MDYVGLFCIIPLYMMSSIEDSIIVYIERLQQISSNLTIEYSDTV